MKRFKWQVVSLGVLALCLTLRSTAPGAAFSPTELSGLTMWLDADSLGLGDGQNVSDWQVSGGDNYGAKQSNVSWQPTYETNEINGKPVVRFGGSATDERMNVYSDSTTHANWTQLGLTGGMTVFAVAKPTTNDGGPRQPLLGDNDAIVDWTLSAAEWEVNRHAFGGSSSIAGPHTSFKIFAGTQSNIAASASNTLLGYVDGVAGTAGSQTNSSLGLGQAVNLAVDVTTHTGRKQFGGDLAELIVYNRVLGNYESNKVGGYLEKKYGLDTAYVAPGLRSYWPMDDGSGSATAADVIGGHDGTLTNMDTNAAWVTDHTGSGDSALQFDGSNDYVNVGNVGELMLSKQEPMSLAGWIYHEGSADTMGLIGTLDNNSPNDGWGLVSSDRKLQFEMRAASGSGRLRAASQDQLPVDTWVHVAATYDGSDSINGLTLYLDGSPVALDVKNNTAGGSLPTDHNLALGAYGGDAVGRYFGGRLDDFAVWNEVLTGRQIRFAMNLGPDLYDVPEPSGLVLAGLALLGLLGFARRRK